MKTYYITIRLAESDRDAKWMIHFVSTMFSLTFVEYRLRTERVPIYLGSEYNTEAGAKQWFQDRVDFLRRTIPEDRRGSVILTLHYDIKERI